MTTITIYEGDISELVKAGCTVGAHWSDQARGQSGHYLTLPDGTEIRARETPCSDDALEFGEDRDEDSDIIGALETRIAQND